MGDGIWYDPNRVYVRELDYESDEPRASFDGQKPLLDSHHPVQHHLPNTSGVLWPECDSLEFRAYENAPCSLYNIAGSGDLRIPNTLMLNTSVSTGSFCPSATSTTPYNPFSATISSTGPGSSFGSSETESDYGTSFTIEDPAMLEQSPALRYTRPMPVPNWTTSNPTIIQEAPSRLQGSGQHFEYDWETHQNIYPMMVNGNLLTGAVGSPLMGMQATSQPSIGYTPFDVHAHTSLRPYCHSNGDYRGVRGAPTSAAFCYSIDSNQRHDMSDSQFDTGSEVSQRSPWGISKAALPSDLGLTAAYTQSQVAMVTSHPLTGTQLHAMKMEQSRPASRSLHRSANAICSLLSPRVPQKRDDVKRSSSPHSESGSKHETESTHFSSADSVTSSQDEIAYSGPLSDNDELLLKLRNSGLAYKEIKKRGNFTEAESTLRGRYRCLTKQKASRVRKPKWHANDVSLLKQAVTSLTSERIVTHHPPHAFNILKRISTSKVPWKKVAQYITERGGSYHFGNATCRKKWDEVINEHTELQGMD